MPRIRLRRLTRAPRKPYLVHQTVPQGRDGVPFYRQVIGSQTGQKALATVVRLGAVGVGLGGAAAFVGGGAYALGRGLSGGAKALGIQDRTPEEKIDEQLAAYRKAQELADEIFGGRVNGLPPGFNDPQQALAFDIFKNAQQDQMQKSGSGIPWAKVLLALAGLGAAGTGIYYLAKKGGKR